MPGFERAPFPPLNQTEIAELTKSMKDSFFVIEKFTFNS